MPTVVLTRLQARRKLIEEIEGGIPHEGTNPNQQAVYITSLENPQLGLVGGRTVQESRMGAATLVADQKFKFATEDEVKAYIVADRAAARAAEEARVKATGGADTGKAMGREIAQALLEIQKRGAPRQQPESDK